VFVRVDQLNAFFDRAALIFVIDANA